MFKFTVLVIFFKILLKTSNLHVKNRKLWVWQLHAVHLVVFLNCCPDCPSCAAHQNSIIWATWAMWAVIKEIQPVSNFLFLVTLGDLLAEISLDDDATNDTIATNGTTATIDPDPVPQSTLELFLFVPLHLFPSPGAWVSISFMLPGLLTLPGSFEWHWLSNLSNRGSNKEIRPDFQNAHAQVPRTCLLTYITM